MNSILHTRLGHDHIENKEVLCIYNSGSRYPIELYDADKVKMLNILKSISIQPEDFNSIKYFQQ